MQKYKTFPEQQNFPRKLTQHLNAKKFRNPYKLNSSHSPSSPLQKDNTLKGQTQHVESAVSTR